MPYREIYIGSNGNNHKYNIQQATLPKPIHTTEDMSPQQTGWSTDSVIIIIVVAISFTLLFLNLLYLILKVFKKQMGCTSFFLMCCATCLWDGTYKLVLKVAEASFPTITEPKTAKSDVGTQMFYSIPLGMGLANGAMATSFTPGKQQYNGYAFTILCVIFLVPRCFKRLLIFLLLLHGVFSIGDHAFPHPVGVQQEPGMIIRYIDVEECTNNGMLPVYAPHSPVGVTYYHLDHIGYTTMGRLPMVYFGNVPFYLLLDETMNNLVSTCAYNGLVTHEVHLTDSYVGVQTAEQQVLILADSTWLENNYNFRHVNWFPDQTAKIPSQCIYLKTPCSIDTHQCSSSHTLAALGGRHTETYLGTTILGDSRLASSSPFTDLDMYTEDYKKYVNPATGHDSQLLAIGGNAIYCSLFSGQTANFYKNYGRLSLVVYEGTNWCRYIDESIAVANGRNCFGYPTGPNYVDSSTFPKQQRENFYEGIYSLFSTYANFDTIMSPTINANGQIKKLNTNTAAGGVWSVDPSRDSVAFFNSAKYPHSTYALFQQNQESDGLFSTPFNSATLHKPADFVCFYIIIAVPLGAYAKYKTIDGVEHTTPTSPSDKYRMYAPKACLISVKWFFDTTISGTYIISTTYMGYNTPTKVKLTVVYSYSYFTEDCPTLLGQKKAANKYADVIIDAYPTTFKYDSGIPGNPNHGSQEVRKAIHDSLGNMFPQLISSNIFYQAHLGCVADFLPCSYECFIYGPHYVCPGHCEDGEVHGFFTVFLSLPPGATLQVVMATSTCAQENNSTVHGAVCLGYNISSFVPYNCTFTIYDYTLQSNCHFAIALIGGSMEYIYGGVNLNGYNEVTVFWEEKRQTYKLRRHHTLYLGSVDLLHMTWWDWVNFTASLIVLFSFLFLVLHVHKWPLWLCYWAKNFFVWSPPEHPPGTCPLCGANVETNWSTHYMYHHSGIMDFFTLGYWIYRHRLPPLNLRYAKKGSRWIQTRAGSHYKYSLLAFILLLIFCCRPQAINAIKVNTATIGDSFSGNFKTFSVLDVKEQGQCTILSYGCKNPSYEMVGGLTCVAHTRPPTCCDGINPVINSGHGGLPWCIRTSCMGGWTTGCFFIGYNCLYACAYTICPYSKLVPYVECKTSTTLTIGVDGQICDISSGNYKCGNATGEFTTTTLDVVRGYLLKDGLYTTSQAPNYFWGNVTGESIEAPICSYYVKHTGAVDTTCTGAQSLAYNDKIFDVNSNGIIRTGGEGDIVPDVAITAPICPETQPVLFTCWHYYDKYEISFVFNNCSCSIWQEVTYACHVTYYSTSTTCCINETCMTPTTGPNWHPTELGYHTTDPTTKAPMSVLAWFQSMFSSWSTWIIMVAVIVGIIILLLLLLGCCKSRTKQA